MKELEELLVAGEGAKQAILGDETVKANLQVARLRAEPDALANWLTDKPKSITEIEQNRLGTGFRITPKPVGHKAPKYLAPEEMKKGVKRFTEGLWTFLKDLPFAAKFLGGAAALYMAADALSPGESKGWLNATTIGYRGKDLLKRLGILERDDIPPSRKAAIDAGTAVHAQVEQALMVSGKAVGAEVAVRDPRLGVHGNIDVLLKGNIPLELKVVAKDAVDTLGQPYDAHASQANFYAHAVGAPFGIVRYIDREDPNHFVEFRVPYSPGRLLSDIEAASSAILEYRNWVPDRYVQWALGRRAEAGIRDPDGPSSAFQTMRVHDAFPRGRELSTFQVALPQEQSRIPYPKIADSPLRAWSLRQGHGARNQLMRSWPR